MLLQNTHRSMPQVGTIIHTIPQRRNPLDTQWRSRSKATEWNKCILTLFIPKTKQTLIKVNLHFTNILFNKLLDNNVWISISVCVTGAIALEQRMKKNSRQCSIYIYMESGHQSFTNMKDLPKPYLPPLQLQPTIRERTKICVVKSLNH